MGEIDDNVRASLMEVIDAEFIRHDERPDGEPIPSFDAAEFDLNFEAETIAGLISDNEDTEDQEQRKPRRVRKEFCRICLCDDRKLSTISAQNRVAFQCILRQDEVSVKNNEPRLAPKVCWQCNARMTSFRVFRTKAIQTNTLLYSLIRPFMNVNEQNTSEQTTSEPSTSEGTQQSELVGLIGNSRCFIHRQGRPQPYNIVTDDSMPSRAHRLSFCVLQRPPRDGDRQEPRQPE